MRGLNTRTSLEHEGFINAKTKTIQWALTVAVAGVYSLGVFAQALPPVAPPLALQEGTETQLTPSQIQEILPWAKNTKATLEELLFMIEGLGKSEKEARLVAGIQSGVMESAPKSAEIFMRFVLNRALKVREALMTEGNPSDIGASDMRIRLLESSVRLALEYYQTDMDYLMQSTEKPVDQDFAAFGARYAQFLSDLNKSFFDASACYQIERLKLGFLQWDLARDTDAKKYAVDIVRINNQLKILPEQSPSNDADSLDLIRTIKRVSSQIGVLPQVPRATVGNTPSESDGEIQPQTAYYKSLVAMADVRDWQKRLKAAQELAAFHDGETTKVILNMLGDPDQDVVAAVKSVLSARSYSSRDLLAIIDAYRGPWSRRLFILQLLQSKFPTASKATALILKALVEESDPDVLAFAYDAGIKRALTSDHIRYIGSALTTSRKWAVRQHMANLLQKIPKGDSVAVKAAIDFLSEARVKEKDQDALAAIERALRTLM